MPDGTKTIPPVRAAIERINKAGHALEYAQLAAVAVALVYIWRNPPRLDDNGDDA